MLVITDSRFLKQGMKTINFYLLNTYRSQSIATVFSAVPGQKFNLTTVLRPCRPLACYWMVFSRPLSLLYWISLNCQVPWGWHCIFRWICLQNAKMDFFPTVLIAFPKTDLDFTDCCMNLFSTMTMFMFLCKYDRPSIILFVVFPSPLKRRSTQSLSCLIFAIK